MSDRVGTGRKATGGARAPATVEDEADAKGKTAGDKDEKREGGSGVAPEAKARAQAEAEAKRLAEDEARRKAVAQAKRLAEQAEAMRKAAVDKDEKRKGGSGAAPEAKVRAQAEAEAERLAEDEARRKAVAHAKRLAEEAEAMRKAAEAETLAAEKPARLEERPKARAYRRAPPPAAASRNGGESAAAPENAPMAPRSMEPPAGAPAPAGVPEPSMPTMASPPPPPAGMTAPDATVAGPPKSWDVVPVFYGTDRAEEPNPRRVAYNSDRGRRLELGRALVTVPKLHEVPQIERPWAIRIPYFNVTIYEEAEDPNKHFTMQEIKKLPKEELLRLVRQRLAGSARFKDQALVFVHGYNTAFDNAVYRTAQIAYDLKFDGAPFVYSWPSGGAVASYTYDRESAGASKPYMRAFLDMVVKETGAKAVSIIAHSMGNQPLLDVLKDMKSSTPEGVVINQVVFAAPDVDSDSFANLAQAIKGLAKGVTLYAASNDRALIVSRNFWGYYRAGDVPPGGPLVLPGVDTIDVTAASTDAFAINHSGYAQNNSLLKDIGELIETGLRPPDQRLLKPRPVATEKGAYWRYVAPPAP
jgi:esterase/lipase superfamily enzyme